jgi:eukaryotic-like serine/threonine-protein kinase
MTPERFQLVSKIYQKALECDDAERLVFVERQCGRDSELRQEVEALLSGGKNAEALLLSEAMKESVRRLSGENSRGLVGQTLDHYEVLELSGVGGMGEVYRARDIKLGREVAIKLLPLSFASGPNRLRFEREARAASSLNHPNILTIHEIERTDEHHYIVSEFIHGETLRQRIKEGRVSVPDALDIAIQIASALSAAHDAGIVHRDIKPENIMLRRDKLVKVLDFGLAKLSDANTTMPPNPEQITLEWFQTDSGIVLGTSSYMSPEQTRGVAVDARTDIWSLGVVLYEMIAGSPPFTGATKSDVMVSILAREPASLEAVPGQPAELKRIFKKTLSKNLDERYQTARELLDDLTNLRQTLTSQGQLSKERTGLSHLKKPAILLPVVALVVLIGIGIAAYKFGDRTSAQPTKPALRTTPFTTFTGREQQPTFSPDGKQIAFSWNGEKGDNFDIYVKLVNSEARPLRLTTNAAEDVNPTWSPDGQQIAFVRHSGPDITIFVIPVLGGTERKLYSGTSAFFSLYEFGNALSWSPDGKYLAFSGQPGPREPNSIFLLSIETLEARKFTTPPEGFLGDSTPAFSPDGKFLAFVRGASSRDVELYVMPASGGEPKRLTFDNRSVRSLAWTADSQWMVFASWFRGLRLWKLSVLGGMPEQLNIGAEFASSVAVSRIGDRLAYSQEFRDTNIWQIELQDSKLPSNSRRLISSTRQDFGPQYSPDGTRIAFTSARTGNNEVWVCDADGMNPLPLTSFGGPDVGSPRWAPDGKQLAFDSLAPGHRDVYVVGGDGGKPRRLTNDNFDNVRPSWSRDGRWIYFGSNRTGDWQLWKSPAEGGQPVQVTKQGGREAFESFDGQFVYYTKGFGLTGLWKVPVTGGEETFVVGDVLQGLWAVIDKGVYFINTNSAPRAVIQFFNFSTGRTTKVAEVERELQLVYPSLAVSADGRFLLFVQADSFESDLMVVDNFR